MFCYHISPKIEETDIITWALSDWDCQSHFLSKKKRSKELHIVYNYIPLNSQIIQPQYPIYYIKRVTDTIIQAKYGGYFIIDVSKDEWAISMKPKDEYKTSFIIVYS